MSIDDGDGRRLLELLLGQQHELSNKIDSIQNNTVPKNDFQRFTDHLEKRLSEFDKSFQLNEKLFQVSNDLQKETKDEITSHNALIDGIKKGITWFIRVVFTALLGIFITVAPTYFGWKHVETSIKVPIEIPQVYTKPTPRPNGAYVQ